MTDAITDEPPLARYELAIDISPDDMHPDRLTSHVNNARYFAYINRTFQQWYELMGTRRGVPDHGAPMAHLAYDFKRELNYPGRALCTLRVVAVGRSSMTHDIAIYDITNEQRLLAGTGRAVHVWRNRVTQQSVPWPQTLLDKCWSGR